MLGLLIRWIELFWTVLLVALVCPWFRNMYRSFHSQVRLKFKSAPGLGEPWCRDGGIPQGCPLSMTFIVALYLPWCRVLESVPGVIYADNLKFVSSGLEAKCSAARFTNLFIELVGQKAGTGSSLVMIIGGLLSWMCVPLEDILMLPFGLGMLP